MRSELFDRTDVKNRFVSVIGRSRIEKNGDLTKLLKILEQLCKNKEPDEEGDLAQEIRSYRELLKTTRKTEDAAEMLDPKDSRKAKLFLLRLCVGIILLFLVSIGVILLFFNKNPGGVVTTPDPPVTGTPSTFVGKKGKIGKDSTNLRENAGEDFADIGTLPPGSEIIVLDQKFNDTKGKPMIWFKVKVLSYGCSEKIPSKCGKDNPSDADEGWVSARTIVGL